MRLLRNPLLRPLHPLACGSAVIFAGICAQAAAPPSYSSLILSDNPVAYYRFEELPGAATAADSSPNGFDATFQYDLDTNSVPDFPLLGLPGLGTNAILFHLYNDASATRHYGFVNIPFRPELSPVTGDGQHGAPFSVECWVQPDTQPADYSIPLAMFGKYEVSAPYGNASGWNFYQTPGPDSYWIFNMKNGAFAQATGVPIQVLQWYHLAATYNGSTVVFYINGVAQVTAGGFTDYLADHNWDGQIGAGDNSGFLPFKGSVDEVAFYTNVLTALQVTNHYQAGLTSFVARPFPPAIIESPASVTVNSGERAKFTVTTVGATPLSYYWWRGGAPVSGAVTNPLSFVASYPVDDGATFSVVVSNVYGSVTSSIATLTVQGVLNLDHQPFSVTRVAGAHSKAAFRVAASGSPPIYYHWFKVAAGVTNVVGGATNDTLWLSGLQLSDDGSAYFAQVTNAFVFTNSDQATLSVVAKPVNVPVTGYARFVVADDPVAYWRLDEPAASSVATDVVGSFDGAYQPNTGTLTFGVLPGIPHETDPAVNLAASAVVSIPYALELNPVTGPWSAEAWVRPAIATSPNFITVFSSMWNSDFGGHLFGWNVYQHPEGYWTLNMYNGSGGGSFTSDFTHHPLDTTAWYHMVITDDLSFIRYYVNNLLVVTLSRPGFGFIPNGINGDVSVAGAAEVLGQRSDNAFDPFNGSFDDAAFYNYALSPEQIQNHYMNNGKLTITQAGKDVVLTWPGTGLTLQSSPTVFGSNFVDVVGASSPRTNAIGTLPQYFRLKLQ